MSITGYYDLHDSLNQQVLTYNPETDYMFFNDSTSERSSIWLPDECDGTMSMMYQNVSYSLHVASDGRVLALPTSTGAYSGLFAQTTERLASLETTERLASLNRGRYDNPAQRIPPSDRRLAPNGCGTNKFHAPDFAFKECCDNHDNCFDDCSTGFSECNGAFLSCMKQSCKKKHWYVRPECKLLADFYYAVVSSPVGFKAFIDAREAC